MFRNSYWLVGIVLIVSSAVMAEIVVHEPNFVVDKYMDRIDGNIPRLEAIRDPNTYGEGIVAAFINQGILTVLRVSKSNRETIATRTGYPENAIVRRCRFDYTGYFNNHLFISTVFDIDNDDNREITEILEIEDNNTTPLLRLSKGSVESPKSYNIEFVPSENGYDAGIYIVEGHSGGDGVVGIYRLDPNLDPIHGFHRLTLDLPNGDLDTRGIAFDITGLYGSYLTMAHTDDDVADNEAVLYQFLPDNTWTKFNNPVTPDVRWYNDMCFSNGGSFGQLLYITDKVTKSVMAVDPNGTHRPFASNFNEISSITVDDTGEFMYVSDYDGVWRIMSNATVTGPQITMQEPKVENDGVHTNPLGVDDVRLLWNDHVLFNNSNVSITDANDVNVPFSVSGSNSQLMIIVFGETLLNDKYTITIHDTVVSAETSNPIDGDDDGYSGGDAVIVMEHRERHDSENDNDIDFADFASFADKWLWSE